MAVEVRLSEVVMLGQIRTGWVMLCQVMLL